MNSTAEILPDFDENDEPIYREKAETFDFSHVTRPRFDDNDNMFFTLEEMKDFDQRN